jgi:hypothetical protein
MRKFTALTVFCFCFVSSPAGAASFFLDFAFSGTVESAFETGPAIPSPIPIPSMVGQAFSESFFFSGASGVASLVTNVPSSFILPVIPPSYPVTLNYSGISFSGGAASLTLSGNNFSGSIGSLAFTYVNGNPSSDVLTAEIPILSAGQADAGGNINLTLEATSASISLSPVPLPPALPLFACALAALGIAAFRQRKLARRMPLAVG